MYSDSMIRFLSMFSVIALYPFLALCNDEEVLRRQLETTSTADSVDDKLSAIQQEMQNLLGRVEMLEHYVSELRKGTELTTAATPINPHPHKEVDAIPQTPVHNTDQTQNAPKEEDKRVYDRALISLKDGRYDEAEKQFQEFIDVYPKSVFVSNAYFWYGEAFFKRNDFERAALQYLKCYKQFPKSQKAPDSLLKLAISLGELGKKKEACAMLSKLNKEFKDRSTSSIKRTKDAINKYGCK